MKSAVKLLCTRIGTFWTLEQNSKNITDEQSVENIHKLGIFAPLIQTEVKICQDIQNGQV